MIFRLFRPSKRYMLVDALYDRLASASRHPALYLEFAIPDTVEGRFEALALHAFLVVRRLQSLPNPGIDVAQELIDVLFARLDRSLRELGVGDLSVGKKIKVLAEAFYGRAATYENALASSPSEMLPLVLARNVLAHETPASDLAGYVLRAQEMLNSKSVQDILNASSLFPTPSLVSS